MTSKRDNFGSRFAVIMAMAGSAVGLGNIWRFPYMVGQHGGAAFIIVYIVCCLVVSLPIFFSEAIIGKAGRADTYGAIEKLAPGSKLKNVSYLAILASFVILSFYSVVGGWSFDYLLRACFGGFNGRSLDEAKEIFTGISASPVENISCMLVFLGLTALIVVAGVEKGIGRFSKYSIPVLFLMVVLIAVESLTLPGAQKGVEYLLKPDFSKLDGPAIAAALGQSFFSLSLGVGTVLTYSSYMKEEHSVLFTGGWTAFFDTVFALVAGIAIMPAVFAAGIEPSAGPSLVFETLPVIFSKMGIVLPIIFFLAILIAALSSSISMLEVVVAWLVDQKHLSRSKATLLVFLCAALLGASCAVAPRVFSACDLLSSNVLMMIGALTFAVVVGWKMPREQVLGFVKYRTIYRLIRYAAPLMIIAIAISNLL
ncbi:MAG: sodium-dependent transporter [Bacteroidales bacterium]|nr:sodium-dependent transporter [Bacteroidales bacterium]